ncbi:15-hydroxyprostaglandin dehydrogenase [NAD(+)]-like isoform X3 [Stegostoma tigrinum]|uniref:15-hydroxyprostaglandin dehydrogenase [NAD(+)]-like isoform X3 n=1 Tax=Stegostoma tigrinum TaxID=3053191 RepID=UPI00202B16D1|nr:15-hydroxyprostaglandin dehydrogenase [NAD(+)]-like isoform X3 [Stegostoma tigrinum]
MILKNCVGLITGASQGLGKAFAESLLKKGAQVVICDINQAQGEITKAEFDLRYGPGRTTFITCDVTSLPQLKDVFIETVQTFGRLDVLCNNAGINNENSWERTISVNLVALIQASYLALDHMRCDRGGKGGSIINVASMSGQWYFLTLLKRHTSCNLDHQSNSIFSLLFVKSYCAQFDHHNHLESYCGQTSEVLYQQHMLQSTQLQSMECLVLRDLLQPSEIAKGFVQLLEDDSLNGAVMKITTSKGIHFENY